MTAPDAFADYGSSVDTSTSAETPAHSHRATRPGVGRFRLRRILRLNGRQPSGPSLRTLGDLTTDGSRRGHRSGAGDRKQNENGSGTDWEKRVDAPDGTRRYVAVAKVSSETGTRVKTA